MKTQFYLHYTKLLFGAVFILHGMRVIKKWTVLVNGIAIPIWVSWVILVMSGYFAYTAHKLKK